MWVAHPQIIRFSFVDCHQGNFSFKNKKIKLSDSYTSIWDIYVHRACVILISVICTKGARLRAEAPLVLSLDCAKDLKAINIVLPACMCIIFKNSCHDLYN